MVGGRALGCQWGRGGCYAQEKVLPVPSSPRAIVQLSVLRKSSETAYLLALVKPIQPQCNKLVGWEGGVGVGGGGGGAVIKVNWRRQSVTRQRYWEMSVAAKDNPAAHTNRFISNEDVRCAAGDDAGQSGRYGNAGDS